VPDVGDAVDISASHVVHVATQASGGLVEWEVGHRWEAGTQQVVDDGVEVGSGPQVGIRKISVEQAREAYRG